MTRSTEDRIRSALAARAEQVRLADLRQPMLAAHPRTRMAFFGPLAAAAALVVVVVLAALATGQARDRAQPPAERPAGPTPVATTDARPTPPSTDGAVPPSSPAVSSPEPPVSTTPAPTRAATQKSRPATARNSPGPKTSSARPPGPRTHRISFGDMVLDAPLTWQLGDSQGDVLCLGPATRGPGPSDPSTASECDGIIFMAAGDSAATVDGYFGNDVCRTNGPEEVMLDHELVTRASYSCGYYRHIWVLNDDPFWSIHVHTPQVSSVQERVVASVRLVQHDGGS